jgi:micrococcal nuclease
MSRTLFFFLSFALIVTVNSCNSKSGKRLRENSGNRSQSSIHSKVVPQGYCRVIKVVDGDTFWINDGSSEDTKIRLIGVDAPESRNSFKKVIGFYGKESKQYLSSLISGKYVRLEYDVDRFDQYKRTLAYVYLENGLFVNSDLVKNGYAMVMTVPPNVKYADLFVALQHEAREHYRGLWKGTNQ